MPNYIGVRCPVCSKKFGETDDIVVCPVCGAPHHRDCYANKGQCAFAADHLSGKEWTDPAGPVPPGPEDGPREEGPREDGAVKVCPRCNASNPEDSIFCQICGNPLHVQPPGGQQPRGEQEWSFPGYHQPVDTISMAYGGLRPEEEIEGETVKDLACYVGSGSAYYLPRFRMMADHGRVISFNLSAMVFSFLYYLNRKMYLLGGFLLALFLISRIPVLLYTWEIYPQVMYEMGLGPYVEVNQAVVDHLYRLNNITSGINFVIVLIASMFANRYYFNRALAAVRGIRQETVEGQPIPRHQYEQRLARAGGSNKLAVILTVVGIAVGLFAFSSFVLYHYIGM